MQSCTDDYARFDFTRGWLESAGVAVARRGSQEKQILRLEPFGGFTMVVRVIITANGMEGMALQSFTPRCRKSYCRLVHRDSRAHAKIRSEERK